LNLGYLEAEVPKPGESDLGNLWDFTPTCRLYIYFTLTCSSIMGNYKLAAPPSENIAYTYLYRVLSVSVVLFDK